MSNHLFSASSSKKSEMKGTSDSLPFFFAWVLVVTVLVGIGSFRRELVQLSSLFSATVTSTTVGKDANISLSANEMSIVYNRARSDEPNHSSSNSIKDLFHEDLLNNTVNLTLLAGHLSEAVEMSTLSIGARRFT